MKKSKILCLSRAPLDYFGGIPAYCVNLYKSGIFDVTTFSYDINNEIKKSTKRRINNIKEVIFPSEITYRTFAISFNYFIKIIKNIHQFNYVHLQYPDPFSGLAVIFGKLINPKLKIIITWHAEIYSSYKTLSPIILLQDLFLFLIARKIIYFTPMHVKDSFLAKIFFVKQKIIIIPNCIDLKNIKRFFVPKEDKFILKNKNQINILSIGRLVSYKGYEYAIKAFSKLDKKYRYKIIGDGPLKKELGSLISSLGLDQRVQILGNVSDKLKYDYLNAADIFMFPSISKSEAYGLVQIEAMCFELPIVNTFLDNGVNFLAPPDIAYTSEPKSVTSLVNAILEISRDDEYYSSRIQKVEKILSELSLEKMIKMYKQIFN